MFPSYRNQSVDFSANQLTGFYMMGHWSLKEKNLKILPNPPPWIQIFKSTSQAHKSVHYTKAPYLRNRELFV